MSDARLQKLFDFADFRAVRPMWTFVEVNEDGSQGVHSSSIDDSSLSGVTLGVAEAEMILLQIANAYFPNPHNVSPGVSTSHKGAILIGKDVADGQVWTWFDEMPLGVVRFQGDLDLEVAGSWSVGE